MLQDINDRATGCLAIGVVVLVVLAFALTGVASYLGGSDSLVAATVNGEEISAQSVQNSVLQQRQRLGQMFGGKLPPNFSDDSLKTQALEQSVNQVLLSQLAEENGYRASNQEVYDAIIEIPAFQKDGKFDSSAYELLLASQRRNKAGFEAEIRASLSHQQFSNAVSDAAFVTQSEALRYKALQDQKRSIDTYTLKVDDFKSEVKMDEAEIKAYYDSKPADFKTTEKARVSYVVLNEAEIQKQVEVNDEKLTAFFDENKDQYKTQEQRKVAHILVKIAEATDAATAEKAEKEAQQKAESLYQQIKSGEKTFEDLASNASDDEFSAKKSGDLGFISRGDMGPAFEKLAFSLKLMDVSQPTKTEAGFEIVKITEIIEAKQKSFSDVKANVETRYRKEEAEKVFLDHSDKLQAKSFEEDGSLDDAAEAVGLKVLSSAWITKNPAPSTDKNTINLESSPNVIKAVFSEDVLKSGKNSDLIEIKTGVVAVVRLLEHQPASRKPMAEVAEELKTKLTEQKARKLVIQKGESMLAQLHNGGWTALEQLGVTSDKLTKTPELARSGGGNKLAQQVVETAFSMMKPSKDSSSFSNTILPNGDYVLIGLTSVTNGQAELDNIERKGFNASMGARERTAALKAIRERAEVELFLNNIQ